MDIFIIATVMTIALFIVIIWLAFDTKMRVYILTKQGYIKRKKYKPDEKTFEFNGGIYNLNVNKSFLRKALFFGYNKAFLYREGVTEPIDFKTFIVIKDKNAEKVKKTKDQKGKTKDNVKAVMLINPVDIKNFASDRVLEYLTKERMTEGEKQLRFFMIILVVLEIIGILTGFL